MASSQLGCCPARRYYGQPVCLSITRSDRVSLLLFAPSGSLQSTQYHPGARSWTHLRLRRLRAYDGNRPPFGMHAGVYGPRILAAALSLSATGALMVLFRVSHPPAGATTLIVSLGIIAQPKELVIIEVAVFLLTAQALAINWLAGLPYPVWREQNRKGRAF